MGATDKGWGVSVLNWVILGAAIAALQACVLPGSMPSIPEVNYNEKYKGVDLAKELKRLETAFKDAKADELYLYSPQNFQQVNVYLRRARSQVFKKEQREPFMESLHFADSYLNRAYTVKNIVFRELQPLIDVRKSLENLDAQKSHATYYRGYVAQITNLIMNVEDSGEAIFQDPARNKGFSEDRQALLHNLKAFEIEVVKYRSLNHGKRILAEAENYDAKNTAPQTYHIAVTELDVANDVINKNVHNQDMITQASEAFTIAAYHLLHISREIATISELDKNKLEAYVLENESHIIKLAELLKMENLTGKSYEGQTALIGREIKRLLKENDEQLGRIAILESKTEQGKDTESSYFIYNNELNRQVQELQAKLAERDQKIEKLKEKINDLDAGVPAKPSDETVAAERKKPNKTKNTKKPAKANNKPKSDGMTTAQRIKAQITQGDTNADEKAVTEKTDNAASPQATEAE